MGFPVVYQDGTLFALPVAPYDMVVYEFMEVVAQAVVPSELKVIMASGVQNFSPF